MVLKQQVSKKGYERLKEKKIKEELDEKE